MTAWSYSSIKTFDQCPKKFFHLRVAKDVEDVAGPEASYGTELHKAAELYIKEGTPIPEKFAFIRPYVEELDRRVGVKYAELKVGVRKEDGAYLPCGFFDKGVWYRGVIDLLVVDGPRAWMIDYKTGKSAKYADMKQLDLMAGAVFTHFPEVESIKSGLLYVVSKEFPKKTHVREKQGEYLSVFSTQLDRLDTAMENGVWNPKQSPLCGWCPVKACEHHQPRRGW